MVTLAIADDFLLAYSKLAKKAQKSARSFVEKFRSNPKSPGRHYEPISNVKDPRLKSVRVTQGVRAIVLAPDSGDVFVLLWVDNHDEAYRWAMNRRVNVHPKTGSLQIVETSASKEAGSSDAEAEQRGDDAVAAAARFSDYDDEALYSAGVPRMLIPSVRGVYTDDDLDALVPHLPGEAAEVLTGLACGMSLDEAIAEALAKPAAEVGPVDTEDVAAALERPQSGRKFQIIDADFDLEGALEAPLEKWRVFLHPAQRALVERSFKGPTRVTGAAGTGKTVAALHRAAYLIKNAGPPREDERLLLFTTFTVNLAADIEEQLSTLLSPAEMARVDVVGIDALATRILRDDADQNVRLATSADVERAWRSAVDLEGDGEWGVDFYKAEWSGVYHAQALSTEDEYIKARRIGRGTRLRRSERRKVWQVFQEFQTILAERGITDRETILRRAREALEARDSQRYYPHIIVDETQDMTAEALRLLRMLGRDEHADDMFLVGDAHQRIYGRPVSLSSCGINVRGRRSRRLRINYRTTEPISRKALSIVLGETFDDLDEGIDEARFSVSLRGGPEPTVNRFANLAEEQRFIVGEIKRLRKEGIPYAHICLAARTCDLLTDYFEPALTEAGIATELLGRDRPKTDNVRLATMHRVKGLEFPVVFIACVQDGYTPLANLRDLDSDDPVVAAATLKRERCLLYVSTSRARDHLFITGHGEPSPLLPEQVNLEKR